MNHVTANDIVEISVFFFSKGKATLHNLTNKINAQESI